MALSTTALQNGSEGNFESMPTISMFYGIAIQMFWRDHNPPHFHAIYSGGEAVINILTLEIMEGSIPRRALSFVIEWALAHRAELLED